MSALLSVDFDAVDALADELAALAVERVDDPRLCRFAAVSFSTGLGGEAGRRASDAATAWVGLTSVLADRCAAIAETLHAAIASYRALDDGLAATVSPGGLAAPTR